MSLYGLVICGGQSSRMGTDKSRLVYYQKPQHEHVADILAPLCEKVVISCNPEQLDTLITTCEKVADLPQFSHSGPIAALLTAFSVFPGHDFLVAGCDYPFLNPQELSVFLASIDKDLPAAAFYNYDEKYEPLLAWYANAAAPLLSEHFRNGEFSLQHFLKKTNAKKYLPGSQRIMTSVDTPEEFRRIRNLIMTENKN